ncbi:MAG: hypothetical protein A2046_16445 [Bacteroidetes bacterium GWA2_30_7]|nr:MAG: hypothetical protein A2046_16445 [Bacteroidetes bacterium GWA2_30_7]
MKKFLLFTAIVFLTFNLLIAQNLIVNGGFEAWTGGTPDSWTTIESGITVAEATSPVHGGSKSGSFTLTTATQGNTDFRQSVNLTSGINYDVSFWVYHTDTTAKVTIYAAGTFTNIYSDWLITNSWQEVTYSFTASTSGAADFGLRFYDEAGWSVSSLMYIDDFSVTQAASTAPVITNIATNPTVPTQSNNVNISATISDGGTIISAYLYWSLDGITFSDSIKMNGTTNSTFTTISTIPAQPLGTTVFYYIKAIDNSSEETITSIYSYNLSLLSAGDVAIIQYRADSLKGFSFVFLKSINQEFTLSFTDNGFNGTSLATSEGIISWLSPTSGVTAGTVVTWDLTNGTDIGTMSTSGSFNFATAGDQIFAFTGDQTNPTYIFAISNIAWVTSGSITTNNSYLPSSLTTGSTAIAFTTEYDNGYYNITPISGSPASIRSSICNEANWTFDDLSTDVQPSSYWSITVGKNILSNTQNTSIYPIPSNDKIYVDNINGCDKIIISNIIGQPVTTIKVDSKFNNEINIENYKDGVYIIQLYKNNKTIQTKRIIKN